METSPPRTGPDGPFQRADARRNHERVFAAALAVFRESGMHGTVPQVAERAGVGKATVYRSYPAKEDLVKAVVQYRLAELERRITGPAAAGSEPHQVFGAYVVSLFESLAHDRLLPEVLAEARSADATGLLARLAQLMEEAKTAGHVRADATALDLRVVLCGLVLQLSTLAERDPALWRRYGELTLQALRPARDAPSGRVSGQ